MSGYLRTKTVDIEFDGDTVTVQVKPMTLLDCAQASKVLSIESPRPEDVAEIVGKYVPKYTVAMSGLRDAAGQEIDIATVATDMYFLELATRILALTVQASVPGNPQKPGG
jgi:hypothetical protein